MSSDVSSPSHPPVLPTQKMHDIPLSTLYELLAPVTVRAGQPKATFINWGLSYTCTPLCVFEPETEEQCRLVLELARREGKSVRVAGIGHSPSDLVCTTGFMLRTEKLKKVIEVSPVSPSGRVCQASEPESASPRVRVCVCVLCLRLRAVSVRESEQSATHRYLAFLLFAPVWPTRAISRHSGDLRPADRARSPSHLGLRHFLIPPSVSGRWPDMVFIASGVRSGDAGCSVSTGECPQMLIPLNCPGQRRETLCRRSGRRCPQRPTRPPRQTWPRNAQPRLHL